MIFVLPPRTSHFTQYLDDAVFSALKRNYEKQLEDFSLRLGQAQSTKHKLAALVTKAWKGAVTMSTCLSAFRKTGIVPLCLEMMLQRIVGKQPVVTDLPHVNYIRSLPDPFPGQERQLKWGGIDHNALKATCLGMEMISMLAPKSQPPKQTRSFVDGGVLMTRPETKATVLEAEVQRRQKLEERAAKAQERLEKKEMRQLAAILKQFEKTRKQQEKANRSSTKISTSTRPGSRKGIKNKGSKTMEAPLIPHSNLAQDYTMPVALYLGKETDCLVPPAFTGL